jgi:hypothetical protein
VLKVRLAKGISKSSMSIIRFEKALDAISIIGTETVESFGFQNDAAGILSKPITETSSGMR